MTPVTERLAVRDIPSCVGMLNVRLDVMGVHLDASDTAPLTCCHVSADDLARPSRVTARMLASRVAVPLRVLFPEVAETAHISAGFRAEFLFSKEADRSVRKLVEELAAMLAVLLALPALPFRVV